MNFKARSRIFDLIVTMVTRSHVMRPQYGTGLADRWHIIFYFFLKARSFFLKDTVQSVSFKISSDVKFPKGEVPVRKKVGISNDKSCENRDLSHLRLMENF